MLTTVILTSSACGRGVRVALLATTSGLSVAPVAPVAPVAVYQKASFCCYLLYLGACGPPPKPLQIRLQPGGALGVPWGLGELWESSGKPYIDRNSRSFAPADVMLILAEGLFRDLEYFQTPSRLLEETRGEMTCQFRGHVLGAILLQKEQLSLQGSNGGARHFSQSQTGGC